MSKTNRNGKKDVQLAIGIDLGTGFSAVDIFEGGRFQPVESPLDGSQVEMIVYHDPKIDEFHVGKNAVLRSFDDEGDNLFMSVKRSFLRQPDEVIYGGRFTPKQLMSEVLRFIWKMLLAARPELSEFPQFGGKKRPADSLAIIVTVPASCGIEEHAHYEAAMRAAGFEGFDGFIAEPIAAARRLAHVNTVRLKNGAKILTVDIGAGTTDITAQEYHQGVFDQIARASGDGTLAGLDFTNALAVHLAELHGVAWDDVYSEGGVNLATIEPERRPFVMVCWSAAEALKRHHSILDQATAVLELPSGRKAVSISRDEAVALWKPLVERFKACVERSLDGTSLTFSDIDHPMLVGGSSRLGFLRDAMGEVMGRDPSEILVCTDSERIVSQGAAEHAFYQDDASQVLENGLGLSVFDRDLQRHRNLLLVAPGQVLPAEGFFMERSGFDIGIMNGCSTLVCKPFVCRSGVRAAVVKGRETFLEDTETIRLQEVQAPLDDFPQGEHAVAIGVKADPTRKLWLLCRATTLENVETVSIPLVLEEGNGSECKSFVHLDVVLVLDCSKSMAKYGKLDMLKRRAKRFAHVALLQRSNLEIVALPQTPQDSHNEGARLACGLSSSIVQLESAIASLSAGGGTPLHSALDLARETFPTRTEGAERVVVAFTDGMPSDPDKARAAAELLKQSARLITVGIGEDVVEPLLRSMATHPEDYFYVEGAESIFHSFVSVTELLWNDGREDFGEPAAAEAASVAE